MTAGDDGFSAYPVITTPKSTLTGTAATWTLVAATPELILGEGTKSATITGFDEKSANDVIAAGDDFTVDFDISFSDTNTSVTIFGDDSSLGTIRLAGTTSFVVRLVGGGEIFYTTSTLVNDTEYAFSLVRVSGMLSVYINGTQQDVAKACAVAPTMTYIGRVQSTVEDTAFTIKNILISNDTAGWSVGYAINSGETVSESASTNTGVDTHTITYDGVTAGDWI
jgi:hypothetical protein